MGMPETLERWTAARVRELPDDGNRYEVVDGELLVTPAPTFDHQEAAFELATTLRAYLTDTGIGHAVMSPADIELDPHTLVQPDVFVVPLIEGRRPKDWTDIRGLVLAVEILSPSTARADRTVKRRRYQRAGVPEYWIVDLDARLVERWRPGDERPEVLTERVLWQPEGAANPLTIDLPDFFSRVLDEL
jgi:Uma2 family endonuclease